MDHHEHKFTFSYFIRYRWTAGRDGPVAHRSEPVRCSTSSGIFLCLSQVIVFWFYRLFTVALSVRSMKVLHLCSTSIWHFQSTFLLNLIDISKPTWKMKRFSTHWLYVIYRVTYCNPAWSQCGTVSTKRQLTKNNYTFKKIK